MLHVVISPGFLFILTIKEIILCPSLFETLLIYHHYLLNVHHLSHMTPADNKVCDHFCYFGENKTNNQATNNLAIYFHQTSQDKLSEASNRQSFIVIQLHDKLHEKLFISTCSFL